MNRNIQKFITATSLVLLTLLLFNSLFVNTPDEINNICESAFQEAIQSHTWDIRAHELELLIMDII